MATDQQDRDVLMTGMFDMHNFGDLMFPLIADMRLRDAGIRLRLVTATGQRPALADAWPSLGFAQVMEQPLAVSGVLIGGGYIVHTHRMDLLREYRQDGVGAWCAAASWLGATALGALFDAPVVWNAPGAPHPLRPAARNVAQAAFAAADYLSLRDHGSRRALGLDPSDVAVAPDTILELDRLWPRASLEDVFRSMVTRLGVRTPDAVLAVHLRRRSLGGADVARFAEALSDICRQTGLTPVFMGLGSAHGDDRMARELHDAVSVPSAVLDQPESLREIAALLAWCRAYAGSSLHGYVGALAYGRPGVLVGRPAYQKFRGLIEHVDRPQDLVGSWDDALGRLPNLPDQSGVPVQTTAVLDAHWGRVRAGLEAPPERRRAQRMAFLRRWYGAGLHQSQGRWAFEPVVSKHDLSAALSGDDVRDVEPM